SSSVNENKGVYIFATKENKNTVEFPETAYLRVWVDFTGVDFRKANFGLISEHGGLFTTDESDNIPDLFFYYKAEGSENWIQYKHGGDGCFGTAQDSSVNNFKGWLAFPVKDFTYRAGTGTVTEGAGAAYPYKRIAGVYMFWDYSSASHSNKEFYLDEFHLVDDYKIFKEYVK
ncbi:hypothetical protein LJB90_04160, partial [Eubacteriales bacterium OttesenSCG-928-G02]|nr:hypothetical protein [Eubacteriales bacterium OttesenSCG-928-G02]